MSYSEKHNQPLQLRSDCLIYLKYLEEWLGLSSRLHLSDGEMSDCQDQ